MPTRQSCAQTIPLFLNCCSYPLTAQSFFPVDSSQSTKQQRETGDPCPWSFSHFVIQHSSLHLGLKSNEGKLSDMISVSLNSLSFHPHSFPESEESGFPSLFCSRTPCQKLWSCQPSLILTMLKSGDKGIY